MDELNLVIEAIDSLGIREYDSLVALYTLTGQLERLQTMQREEYYRLLRVKNYDGALNFISDAGIFDLKADIVELRAIFQRLLKESPHHALIHAEKFRLGIYYRRRAAIAYIKDSDDIILGTAEWLESSLEKGRLGAEKYREYRVMVARICLRWRINDGYGSELSGLRDRYGDLYTDGEKQLIELILKNREGFPY